MKLSRLFDTGEQPYRNLVELNPDITVINCDGKIVFINRAGAQALGAENPDELIGRSVMDFIHPDNQYVIRQCIPHPQNKGQTIPRAEEQLVRLDGSVICVETTAMPITYQGQQATLVIGHDITERKNIEDKLTEHENQFCAFTESTPDAILIVDYDAKILSWSPGAQNLFGYAKQEIIGKPSSLLLPEGDYREGHEQGVKVVHETAFQGKMGSIFESVGVKKDGTHFPIEISISLFETTTGTYYGAVIIRDITARRQNEKLLTETNAFLDSIIENSPDGIVVADIDGCIIRVNSWFAGLLGFHKDECIGKYILDFFPRTPDTYEAVTGDTVCITEEFIVNSRTQMMRLFDEGKALSVETYVIRKDRRVIPVAQNVALLYDRAGDVRGAFGILRDISSHKQLVKELHDQSTTLRTLINMTPESLFLLDIEGKVIIANETLARRLNTTTHELIGNKILTLFPPECREELEQRALEAIRTGKRVQFEDTRQDRYLESFIEPVLDENGMVKQIGVYSLDVTEKRQAAAELRRHRDHLDELVNAKTAELTAANQKLEKEMAERLLMEDFLRKSEEQYRMLVEHANSIILRMDQNGVVRFINEFAQKFFCFSPEEIVGRNVVGTIVPETDSSGHDLVQMIRDIGQRPELYAFNQNENMRHNGERVWIAWTNKALCDDAGMVREILCIGNDITMLKQAEDKLLNYQKQLQSLASELSLAEERERRRIAVDLHDRIAQSLAFARIKIDTIKSAYGSDELGRMLNEVAELLGQTIQETRSLTIEICPPILYELGFEAALEWLSEQAQNQYGIKTSFANDQQQKPLGEDIRVVLFQAARELLVNVAKHAQTDTARLSIERMDSQVRINVEDDGIGFDMAAAEARLGSNGGGFGLFSIRERLKYLGGSLECNSQAGRGTRISITAPLKQ